MTAPTGCHTCGGGAGRHDEAAHSDWPAEVDTCDMPVGYGLTCTLPGDHEDGCEMPLPPYSRKPITLPDGTPVIGWSGPATPTRPQRCDCGRPVPASSSCGCHCAEHDERYDPSPEPIDRSIQ